MRRGCSLSSLCASGCPAARARPPVRRATSCTVTVQFPPHGGPGARWSRLGAHAEHNPGSGQCFLCTGDTVYSRESQHEPSRVGRAESSFLHPHGLSSSAGGARAACRMLRDVGQAAPPSEARLDGARGHLRARMELHRADGRAARAALRDGRRALCRRTPVARLRVGGIRAADIPIALHSARVSPPQ